MSTKRDHKEAKERSLMLDLENAVLALEAAGHEQELIFSYVNCIFKGFITNGAWAQEYLDYCAEIIEARNKRREPEITIDSSRIILPK